MSPRPHTPRDRQPERMDDPRLPAAEHEHALRGLSRLNRISGVAGAMYRQIRHYAADQPNEPLRILDVASGSGDLPVYWARRARKREIPLQITAADVSSVAVEEQQRRASEAGVKIRSLQLDCLTNELPAEFDLVTCSLFMHHLEESQATKLLQQMHAAAARAVLVCDLERSRLNLALISIASRLVTRSGVVHTDAVLSVNAAFTRTEFKTLAEQSLGTSVTMTSMFPCRFAMSVDTKASAESTEIGAIPEVLRAT